jgi:2-phospho-L-lactate transferase/gluconeogenesis factor (CofD/UPF0052 family)
MWKGTDNMETLLVAVVSGACTGLVTWGGMRIEMRWLRRDVDQAHARIDRLEQQRGYEPQRGYR